jgi:hypothetical protein
MSLSPTAWRALLSRWESAWCAEVPPYSAALLRIAFGALALVSLAGLMPVDMFWTLDGLSPIPGNPPGPRAWLMNHGLGTVVGRALFVYSVVAATATLVGYRSGLAVLATFMGLWLQLRWNRLPLSSAHQVLLCVFFCLIWTETGQVWSVDAWRRLRRGLIEPVQSVPIWPLRLICYQISLVYLSSALWKLLYPAWRDGSAVHWVLNLNAFHRFPWPLPTAVEPMLSLATWGIVLFELSFPFLVWRARTRTIALILGLALHIGLWLTLELGPFSFLMVASYIAFLDPHEVAKRLGPPLTKPLTIPSSQTSSV